MLQAVSVGVAIYAVIVASLLGSFINLAADRLPRGESVVRPRSHCTACGRVLNALDLLPVVGYVMRRGRCATCGASIGISSPLIEAACIAAMVVAIAIGGVFPGAVAGLALVALIGGGRIAFALARRPAMRGARSG